MLVSMQAGLQSLRRAPPAVLTYATWNPSDKDSGITLSNGDLTASGGTGVRGTIGKSSGKWYWEVLNELSTNDNKRVGIARSTADIDIVFGYDENVNAYVWRSSGSTYGPNGNVGGAGSWTAGDVLMFALDLDAGRFWIGKNGTWLGDPAAGTGQRWSSVSGTYFPAWCAQSGNGSAQCTANFGASALSYTPPTGFNSGWYTA